MEDYPRTIQEFERRFSREENCRAYLVSLRWPDGFRCPQCKGTKAVVVRHTLYQCCGCRHQTSATAGTIFQDTRKPLVMWFRTMWYVTSQKNGASALGLQRVLGLASYETAWAWLHKLRRAMVRPDRDLLSGVVELDTTYVGGQTQGTDGMGTDKVPVMVAVERIGPHKLGRVRLGLAYGPGSLQLVDFARATIAPGSTIRTDGDRGLRRLAELGYTHEYVNMYLSDDKSQELPGVHLVASLLKR